VEGGGMRGVDTIQTKQKRVGTSTSHEQEQEQHLPIRHGGRPVDYFMASVLLGDGF